MDTSNQLQPVVLTAYIYWCTSAIMSCAKVGMWSGTLYDLWKRYATCYGSDLTLIVFECDPSTARNFEILTHQALQPWHYLNELFYKNSDCLKCFQETVTSLTFDRVTIPDRAPMHHSERERLRQISGYYNSVNDKAKTLQEKKHIEQSKESRELKLIGAKDITNEEFAILHEKVVKKGHVDALALASYQKHVYKTAWGIDAVDQAWIDIHGTNPGNAAVNLCMQMLSPDLLQDKRTTLYNQKRIPIINEIMQIFNWTTPFDTDKPVALNSVFQALMQTKLFKEYNTVIKLFNRRAKPGRDVWRTENMYKPLQCVMNACGVQIESIVIDRDRQGGQDKNQYAYSIKSSTAVELARLVNLQFRNTPIILPDQVRQYLSAAGFGPYDRLRRRANVLTS